MELSTSFNKLQQQQKQNAINVKRYMYHRVDNLDRIRFTPVIVYTVIITMNLEHVAHDFGKQFELNSQFVAEKML